MNQTTCPIHKKVLVCPTCLAVARGRQAAGKAKPSLQKPKRVRPSKWQDPAAFTNKDLLALFERVPKSTLDAASLQVMVAAAYPEKKAKANLKRIRRLINFLFERDKIERVSEGKYRLKSRQDGEENDQANDQNSSGAKA